MMSLIVGVTGGIGCGKTSVTDRLMALGVPVIDTDRIAHQITGPGGAAMPALLAHFGATCTDTTGALDRPRMRALIFSRPEARRELEHILHPMIFSAAQAEIAQAQRAPWIALVVPLLDAHSRYLPLMQHVVVIDCDESQQIARTMQRSGLDESMVREIMRSQIGRQDRLALADEIIDNRGDTDALDRQVRALNERCHRLAASKSIASTSHRVSE